MWEARERAWDGSCACCLDLETAKCSCPGYLRLKTKAGISFSSQCSSFKIILPKSFAKHFVIYLWWPKKYWLKQDFSLLCSFSPANILLRKFSLFHHIKVLFSFSRPFPALLPSTYWFSSLITLPSMHSLCLADDVSLSCLLALLLPKISLCFLLSVLELADLLHSYLQLSLRAHFYATFTVSQSIYYL